jgi:hypothetical protein
MSFHVCLSVAFLNTVPLTTTEHILNQCHCYNNVLQGNSEPSDCSVAAETCETIVVFGNIVTIVIVLLVVTLMSLFPDVAERIL